MKSSSLGVAVVRLQVPELHAGHRYLLNTVTAIHARVLVVIGVSETRLTPHDPLTFEMRRDMLLASYPKVAIVCLNDQPSNEQWSQALDTLIADNTDDSNTQPVLYGGRDSFLKYYCGVFRTFELPPIEPISGTDIRAEVKVKNSLDFREGMIYASKYKYPIAYQCVDVAVMKHGAVLLGQKKTDNGKWRFIGGFVSTSDDSLEAAAKREVREEIGVEPGDTYYVGSAKINDFRYSRDDTLMSAFFVMAYSFGCPKAADDLDNCAWFAVEDVWANLVPEHQPLAAMLVKYLLFVGGPIA